MHRLKIILARHGVSQWNKEGIHQGQCRNDPGLAEEGVIQVQRFGEYLADMPIMAIWTSPLPRAYQTASIIHQSRRRAKAIPLILDKGLMEITHGVADGMRFSKIKEKYPDGWKKMMITRVWHEPLFPGGEAPIAAARRMFGAKFAIARIASIFKRNSYMQDGTIVVVAHGAVNTFFLCEITGTSLTEGWEKFPQDNCCTNIIIWDGRKEKFTIESVNNTDYLGDLKYTPLAE